MPFTFRRLEIAEILLIEPHRYEDNRGFFLETYKYSDFLLAGVREHFVQDNYSHSFRGVLRGLHYQKNPHAQGKLVQCIRGRIFDVAVDIRRGSPTYMRWVGADLSEDNSHMVYIPPGFAHGFLVMSDVADVMYKCTGEYAPDDDRGILWNDPDIRVGWPVQEPTLSEKDKRHPLLRDSDNNFSLSSLS